MGGKRQIAKLETLIPIGSVEDDEVDESHLVGRPLNGECEMCERDDRPLTFHHLVPKETHRRWLRKRALPTGFPRGDGSGGVSIPKNRNVHVSNVILARRRLLSATEKEGDPGLCLPTSFRPGRLFLNRYGVFICRPCHNHVHGMGSNILLANELNSLERILADERTKRWVGWKSGSRKGK